MAKTKKAEATERARRIKLLVMDVDGVLTDGVLLTGDAAEGGAVGAQGFHVHDGLGIVLAHTAGLATAWITGRRTQAVRRRAQELGVGVVLDGVRDKGAALQKLADEHGLPLDEVAFIGDDLNDVLALRLAGLAACPSDAVSWVQTAAHYVAVAAGGRGAVREVVELVLRAQGRLEWAQAAYVAALQGAGEGSDAAGRQ